MMLRKYLLLFLLVLLVNSCCNLFGPEIDGVQLRIMNNSDIDFDEVFVNGVSLGKVEKYEFSEYKHIDNLYRYGAIRISANDTTFGFGVLDYAGEVPLDEGYYTYMLSVDYENYQIHLEFCKGNDIPGKSQPNNRNNLIDESIKYITNSGLEDSNGDLFIIASKHLLQTFNPTISNVPNTHVKYLENARTLNSINTKFLLKTDNLGHELYRKQIPIEVHSTYNNFKILKSSSGDFLLAGTAEIFTESGYKLRTAIIKLDQNGNYLWTKTFGNGYSEANDIIEKSDGTFLVTGRNDFDHTWILNINKDGNQISDLTFDYKFQGEAIIELEDGFIIVGDHLGDIFAEPNSGILKIDANGNTVWDDILSNSLYSVIETSSKDLIIVGSANYQNALLLKYNLDGNLIWRKDIVFDDQYIESRGYSVVESSDSNYLMSGLIDEENALFSIDTNGAKLWTKSFPNNNIFANTYENSIISTLDDNILLIGSKDNNIFLAKVNNEGETLFQKLIGG